MATISAGDRFEVFKFRETGLVALCSEVTQLAGSGELEERFGVNLRSARYRESDGLLKVVFDYLPEEDPLPGMEKA